MKMFLLLWLVPLLVLVMAVTRVESLLLVLPTTTTAAFTKTWCRYESIQSRRASISAAPAIMHTAKPRTARISTHQSHHSIITKLNAVYQKRQAILDGAEWASIKNQLPSLESAAPASISSSAGIMTVVTGTLQNNGNDQQQGQQRVVGIQAPVSETVNSDNNSSNNNPPLVALAPDCWVYKNALARIPKDISDELAMSTLVASLAPIHCAIPRATQVGGSDSDFVPSKEGRVVVVGGSEYATFVARGIAAMGVDVSIVSTGNPQIADVRVESLDPAVGELQIGFCSHVGEFDSLVDTLGDEQGSQAEASTKWFGETGGVLSLLKSRHKCERYISTMTASQRIIRDDGVIFGPGKVKDHVRKLSKASTTATAIIPPTGFGTTVQTLLEKGITYTWKSEGSALVRTWSLPEVWELTSWPRDSDSTSNVRFGFPVVDDLDANDEYEGDFDENDFEEEDEVEINGGFQSFITDIAGVQDLTREVINQDKDCVLFLSAKYCRTCKTIAPAYTRMARINHSDKLLFCRADTTGPNGKELSKTLGVNAVPLFLLFKQGERFGTPLLVNKLPSKKLDLALEFLRTGSTWDSAALEKVKEKGEERRK